MSEKEYIKNLIENISDVEISKLEINGIEFDEQRKLIIKNSESEDFQAVPGSGKTTLLVAKLLLIAEKWPYKNRGICVLSHTNVAKDEIHKKIKESGIGKNLLKYPHFIGTIQSFVDKFLGIPSIKFSGFNFSLVDSDFFNFKAMKMLKYRSKLFLKNKYIDNLKALKILYNDNDLDLNVPGFAKESESETYKNLINIKKDLCQEGIFLYSEMFSFSNFLLQNFPELHSVLRKRFPIVFVDEAQDNNKTQESFLESVFSHPDCIYQRFGDQDQAIYDFDGAEETNSFPVRLSSLSISDSKRFSETHIKYINPFKWTGNVQLFTSINSCKCEPQFLFYNPNSPSTVVESFLNLIDEHYDQEDNPIVKIIGFVGKEVENPSKDRRIESFISGFLKNRNINKFNNLIDLVYYLNNKSGDFYKSYFEIIGFILKNFRIYFDEKKLSLRNKKLINNFLEAGNQKSNLRKGIIKIFKNEITEDRWKEFSDLIIEIFNIQRDKEIISKFKENICLFDDDSDCRNLTTCDNNNCLYTPEKKLKVEVTTIHDVKGETHDATLVLETKKNYHDVSYCFKDINNNNKTRIKFKRQLYVATSRAKSLLCIAVENNEDIKNKIDESIENSNFSIL